LLWLKGFLPFVLPLCEYYRFALSLSHLLKKLTYIHVSRSLQSPLVNFINHDSTKANVELRWATSAQHDHVQVHNISIDDLKTLEHTGLLLEFVATKDIQSGDELFLDYGSEWQRAWDTHIDSWNASREKQGHTHYAHDVNKSSEVVRTQREQERVAYPENLFTSCYYSYAEGMRRNNTRRDGDLHQWMQTNAIFYDRNLRPCMILDRRERNGRFTYTALILNRFGLKQGKNNGMIFKLRYAALHHSSAFLILTNRGKNTTGAETHCHNCA